MRDLAAHAAILLDSLRVFEFPHFTLSSTNFVACFVAPVTPNFRLLESYDDAELFLVNGERSWCEDDGVHEDGEDRDGLSTCVKKSLICAVLNGYMNFLFDSDTDNQRDVKTLRVLIAKCNYTHKDVIHGARMLASFFCFAFDWMGHFIDLVQNAFEALNIQPVFIMKRCSLSAKKLSSSLIGCSISG